MRNSRFLIAGVLFFSTVIFVISLIEGVFLGDCQPPLLVIAALCLVVIIIMCSMLFVIETRRRGEIRTALVGKSVLFNSETGVVVLSPVGSTVDLLQAILSHLTYKEAIQEFPTERQMKYFDCIVRTSKFKSKGKVWEGSVQDISCTPPELPIAFSSKEELSLLLQ